MFSNYVLVAIRSIAKNKLYAGINILGLAMGLAVYIFGGLLANYEYTHDSFFKNVDRIYSIRSIIKAEANVGVNQIDGVQSAAGPVIKAELTDVEAVARTIRREFLLTVGEDSYYQSIRFADPDLLTMFDFDYIYGNETALNDASGILITESIAKKYFGDENPMGKTIILDHEHELAVTAIIQDLPANTHFNSLIVMDLPLGIIAPMSAMERITGFVPDENWGDLSLGNMTYVMLPPSLDGTWLSGQMDGIYERHYKDETKKFVSSIQARSLIDANLALWDMLGIPAITIVEMLGLLVLIVACVNYTNLATAQSMGRAREVGLRKTLGAGRRQLLAQFITESLTITVISMALALALLELAIPLFNSSTGKILTIDYLNILPWLILTVLLVGVLAGSYPAYLITRTNPIEALRDTARKGSRASWVRSSMIGMQFTISVFMLALVLVVTAQNSKVEESSNIFPKSQIYTLDRINVEQIEARHETLRNEMLAIPGVENFTYSSQVPYEQNNSSFSATPIRADKASSFMMNVIRADHAFMETYEIPILAGRSLSLDVARDTYVKDVNIVNVIVNELALKQLGFASNEAALGQDFYDYDEGEETTVYTIIGVIPDQNFLGFHNVIKPLVFFAWKDAYRLGSIKLSKGSTQQTVTDIENAWKRVIPDYPMQGKFLDATFEQTFKIFEMGSKALAAFAMFALVLALVGLFGLAAFMAEQRTKEIGIRKVLGASTTQIIKLLIWQFSKPVLWATPIALLLAYGASYFYLEFFADRIGLPYATLIGAGITGLILSWVTVAIHAFKVARQNPVSALHYE